MRSLNDTQARLDELATYFHERGQAAYKAHKEYIQAKAQFEIDYAKALVDVEGSSKELREAAALNRSEKQRLHLAEVEGHMKGAQTALETFAKELSALQTLLKTDGIGDRL